MQDILAILRDYGMLLLVGQYPHGPVGGLVITLALSILGVALAFPLGVLMALARISPYAVVRLPAIAVIAVVRGVPLIMFIFWVYFFLPVLTGRPISGFTTLLVTLVIYEAAYLAEIVRAGIEGLPKGQMEGARAVGLTYMQAMRLVILPQALRLIIPPLTSQYLNVIKSSSLGAAIAYPEVFLIVGGTTLNQTGQAIESMAIVMAVFLVINLATAALMNWYNRAVALKER